MDSWILGLAQHGYPVLFVFVFLEAIGMPVPAPLGLLVAGGATAHGPLNFPVAWAGSVAVMVAGDTILFTLGRYSGWWLLGLLCRLSINPESCILRAADAFYKRGRVLLLFVKFIPGINTLAAPLAGSMNMRFSQYVWLDWIGASLYTGAYLGVGFLFSDALGAITKSYQTFGQIVAWAVGIAVVGYLGFQFRLWLKTRGLESAPLVSPATAAAAVETSGGVIYDVRSHGYYDPRAVRIKGSKRMEPNALHQTALDLPQSTPIFLYCTCLREATSARVARDLMQQGIRPFVIQGGLRAWRKAGLPVEKAPREEMAQLPVFQ